MKEAQPTCTHGATNYKLGNTYCAQCNLWLHSGKPSSGSAQLVGLRAELEQVRQLRESDALEAKIEWANAIGRAEASESREKRVREAAEIALRQWMVNYALCAEDDIETAQHLEGQMYRAARRALEGE